MWPAYRCLDEDGSVRSDIPADSLAGDVDIDPKLAVKMYEVMCQLQALDSIYYDAQRQGRISFYMTASGEEAIHIGCGAALANDDMIFGQYREQGVLMWRGFTLQQFSDQMFSNADEPAKGRQMPIHYGSKALSFATISSPLSTQIPQAVGAAYSYKLENAKKEHGRNVAVTFFGEGAASEGDTHAALNFAATLDCPILFVCRNNGYAISTGVKDQYRGDGIASRGVGYGIASIRVDGNCVLAVHGAMRKARAYAIENNKPVLLELMSYRVGHHSTSDDSTRYREMEEINHWKDGHDPTRRFRAFIEAKGLWNDEREQMLRDKQRAAVLEAMAIAESKPKPGVDTMFEDVYKEKTRELERQQAHMEQHTAMYPNNYSIGH
jgi:2-oxoisovalerate dehydrogenase E1 component alpha subunit